MTEASRKEPRDPRLSQRVLLTVRVTPRSSRPSVELGADDILHARVTTAPVGGAANKAVLKLIAESLRIAPSRVSLLSGHQSRHKRVLIEGLSSDNVRDLIQKERSSKRT